LGGPLLSFLEGDAATTLVPVVKDAALGALVELGPSCLEVEAAARGRFGGFDLKLGSSARSAALNVAPALIGHVGLLDFPVKGLELFLAVAHVSPPE
jgi:hypothetical protein